MADGMRFVVSLLPDYPTFAFRLVQILTRSPNGIKSLSMAVFAPRRLRETVNAKIAVIVLDYICKVDALCVYTSFDFRGRDIRQAESRRTNGGARFLGYILEAQRIWEASGKHLGSV